MLTVGDRVETEYGTGVVAESSPRRVFIQLDDGQTLNVATGTYGYERIKLASGWCGDNGSAAVLLLVLASLVLFFAPVVLFAVKLAGSVAGVL